MVSLAAKSKLYPARGLFLSDLDRAVFSDGAFRLAGLVSRTVKASLDRFELISRAASLEYGVVCIIFGYREIGLAFGEILILTACVLLTTVLFWRIDKVSGVLLAPYLIWLAFAATLNGFIWHLN